MNRLRLCTFTSFNISGLRYNYKLREHVLPERINSTYRKKRELINSFDDRLHQQEFVSLFREQRWAERRKQKVRDFNHVCGLVKRFPNLDLEAVKQQYPDVDLERVFLSRRTRGHRIDNPV